MTGRHEVVVDMFGDGATYAEIARVLDMTVDGVGQAIRSLRRQGVDLQRRTPLRPDSGPRLGIPYDQMLAGTWTGGDAA